MLLISNNILTIICQKLLIYQFTLKMKSNRIRWVATLYLLEQGVKITGTDGWSWDGPFVHTQKKYLATQDPTLIWESHKASREMGYCHLEKLHNLECLPNSGFKVSCFPVKIKAASAGWTRAVAIIE